MARLLSAGGVTHDDVIQMFFRHGFPVSWLGFHGGAESIGSSVIPTSAPGIEQQIAILQDFRSTVIIGASSDAACLAARLEELGLDHRRLSLRIGFFGGEPWSEEERGKSNIVSASPHWITRVRGNRRCGIRRRMSL